MHVIAMPKSIKLMFFQYHHYTVVVRLLTPCDCVLEYFFTIVCNSRLTRRGRHLLGTIKLSFWHLAILTLVSLSLIFVSKWYFFYPASTTLLSDLWVSLWFPWTF